MIWYGPAIWLLGDRNGLNRAFRQHTVTYVHMYIFLVIQTKRKSANCYSEFPCVLQGSRVDFPVPLLMFTLLTRLHIGVRYFIILSVDAGPESKIASKIIITTIIYKSKSVSYTQARRSFFFLPSPDVRIRRHLGGVTRYSPTMMFHHTTYQIPDKGQPPLRSNTIHIHTPHSTHNISLHLSASLHIQLPKKKAKEQQFKI